MEAVMEPQRPPPTAFTLNAILVPTFIIIYNFIKIFDSSPRLVENTQRIFEMPDCFLVDIHIMDYVYIVPSKT